MLNSLPCWGVARMESFRYSHAIVRFGDFELDQSIGELRKEGGTKIRLQEQPLQILRILLERPGKIITREELREKIWPSDTFVDFDHGINNAIKRLREALGDTAEMPRYVETLPRRGYRFIANLQVEIPVPSRVIESLAVLPLENLSGDPGQEYFADGLTEALITTLAKIRALRVVSRTTAMHYKGVHRPLPQLACELGVDAFVEGSVLRSGERVRISAQLIDAKTDSHLWAESYERDLRDVLTLQSEVAGAIAREIQITLTPQERTQLAPKGRVNPEAYVAYLKGRYYWNKRTPDAATKAAEYLQRAIEKDPTYAAAYASLADGAAVTGFWGFVPPEEGFGRAKSIAQRALEIDETAEAHAALGWALFHYDFDFQASEREFRRSIELNSGYATGAQWYSMYLTSMGRTREAVAEIKRALQLDPLSLIINMTSAWIAYVMRRNEEALDQCLRTIELDPTFAPARYITGMVCEKMGLYPRGIAELQEANKLSGDAPAYVAQLCTLHAYAGEVDSAVRILEQLQELSQQRYVMPYYLAMIYTALNRRDEAFYMLERAYRERAAWAAFTKTDPRLDGLHSDARFDDLLRRMKFPILHPVVS
jgi:TolB-like protein/Tfp pilus assembly protein PilF